MLFTILLVLSTGLAVYVLKIYRQFVRHISEAKASGIPYIIVPFFINNTLYFLFAQFLLPIFHKFPEAWKGAWLEVNMDWGWKRRYEPFQKMGSDVFLAVSPERISMYVADADVTNQITTRKNDFTKPIEVYTFLDIYGSNLLTTEGEKWRHQRKFTGPSFSEKSNHLVWTEAIVQAQAMVSTWFGDGLKESDPIHTVAKDCMRFSLNVISKVTFGNRLGWPGKQIGELAKESEKLAKGHAMNYRDALGTVLEEIILVATVPHSLLRTLPFESTKRAYQSFTEWGRYMQELFVRKKAEALADNEGKKTDLLGAILEGAQVTADPKTQTLTDTEILGNCFFFIVAGHETTAGAIHFSLVLLALHVASQRHLQQDLDNIFEGKHPDDWNYDRDIPRLFSGMAAAVMNEELRVIPPVVYIPKCTAPNTPQQLEIGGKMHTVPGNTYIEFITSALHRNPRLWPAGPPTDPSKPAFPLSNRDNDLEEFKPERWLLTADAKRETVKKTGTYKSGSSDLTPQNKPEHLPVHDPSTVPDTDPALYKPPKGTYLPFSGGQRSCLGKRFAQVEILTVLAVIFSKYSVELAVDEWATNEEVDRMGLPEKKKVWMQAKEKVEGQLRDDMGSLFTLGLQKGHVPLRLVERGRERFDF